MYLRHLKIQHIKLFGDFELSFTEGDGPDAPPRMWTVIIGENGTGKSTLLQAIALASVGQLQVNRLAGDLVTDLRDARAPNEEATARAVFDLDPYFESHPDELPIALPTKTPPRSVVLRSRIRLGAGQDSLRGRSYYRVKNEPLEAARAREGDPLDEARSRKMPHWFVAGYGISRALPDVSTRPELKQPWFERLEPLFRSGQSLTSTAFANYFDKELTKAFARVLQGVLFPPKSSKRTPLLPALAGLELRGYGGVRKAGDLQDAARFSQRVGGKAQMKLSATSLSHGYQSTIAWVADLVGHIMLEAGHAVEPADMTGLVLIDELDLYLHPTWQVSLVRVLRETFPKVQFVVTTHSPLLLAGLRPEHDEVVRLGFDEESGDIVRVPVAEDPRLLTGTELYRRYFGIDDIYPDPAGRALRDYRYIAANPYRSDEDNAHMRRLLAELRREDIDPGMDPVERERP